jgi:flagellar biosynthesis/type III secretory pathway ATPase
MSRHNSADVTVIGMIGERNREVRGFLEKELGPEGRKRSVVVCATSERPAPCAYAPVSWPWRSPNISAIRAPASCW